MIQPGCFGVPSIFSFTSRVCGKCDHHGSCQSQAHAALLAAPAGIADSLLDQHNEFRREMERDVPEGVTLAMSRPAPKASVPRAKISRIPLTDEQVTLLGTLSKKSAEYLKKLMVRGMDKIILEAAQRGENAFTKDKHRPYHLALEKLLEGGLTKPYLRAAYCEELGWSEAAAFSQVSMIWHIFPAMGLAVEQGCALVASPTVRCKNSAIKYLKGAI